MASRDKTQPDSLTGMAAGRMAEKAGDPRTEAPVERKTYPYERINSLIDSIPSAEGVSVLGPIKEAAKGLNSVLAITSGDYEGTMEGMVKATVDAGLGAGALGVGRGALKSGVKNVQDQVSIFAAVDEKNLPSNMKRAQTMIDKADPYSLPQPQGMQRTAAVDTTMFGRAYTTAADPGTPVGPNERREAERWWSTRTVRNASGQLMREIDDSQAIINIPDEVLKTGQGGTYLRDMMDYPELYKDYPEIADIPVIWKDDPLDTSAGFYDSTNKGLVLNSRVIDPNDPVNTRKLILHELQHAVSSIDIANGFQPGRGSDPSVAGIRALRGILDNARKWRGMKIGDLAKTFKPEDVKYVKDMVATYNIMDDLLKKSTGIDTDQFVAAIDDSLDNNRDILASLQSVFKIGGRSLTDLNRDFGYKVYERAMGEITAREVEIRSQYDSNMRGWVYPRLFDEPSRGKAALKDDWD